MPVPPGEIHRLAALKRLDFSQDEINALSSELTRLLDNFNQSSEVDTEGIIPLHHVFDRSATGRPDDPGRCLPVESALEYAPDSQENFFRVPRTVK